MERVQNGQSAHSILENEHINCIAYELRIIIECATKFIYFYSYDFFREQNLETKQKIA